MDTYKGIHSLKLLPNNTQKTRRGGGGAENRQVLLHLDAEQNV